MDSAKTKATAQNIRKEQIKCDLTLNWLKFFIAQNSDSALFLRTKLFHMHLLYVGILGLFLQVLNS